jgi:hypothetical protein
LWPLPRRSPLSIGSRAVWKGGITKPDGLRDLVRTSHVRTMSMTLSAKKYLHICGAANDAIFYIDKLPSGACMRRYDPAMCYSSNQHCGGPVQDGASSSGLPTGPGSLSRMLIAAGEVGLSASCGPRTLWEGSVYIWMEPAARGVRMSCVQTVDGGWLRKGQVFLGGPDHAPGVCPVHPPTLALA